MKEIDGRKVLESADIMAINIAVETGRMNMITPQEMHCLINAYDPLKSIPPEEAPLREQLKKALQDASDYKCLSREKDDYIKRADERIQLLTDQLLRLLERSAS